MCQREAARKKEAEHKKNQAEGGFGLLLQVATQNHRAATHSVRGGYQQTWQPAPPPRAAAEGDFQMNLFYLSVYFCGLENTVTLRNRIPCSVSCRRKNIFLQKHQQLRADRDRDQLSATAISDMYFTPKN